MSSNLDLGPHILILRKMLYADDLAVVMDSKEELQMALSEWKELFERHMG